jgi:hypothetical protein
MPTENYNHPVSVAKVIMTIKKGQEELDQFTLTRSEYAKELGITPNAVRMRIRETENNPDSQFVAMPSTITPAGIELNPITEPIEEPKKVEEIEATNKL